jgi:hypothetical protein
MPSSDRYRRGLKIPPFEIRARIISSIEGLCPECGHVFSVKYMDWRKPHLECGWKTCQKTYLPGVLILDDLSNGLPPFNAFCSPFTPLPKVYNATSVKPHYTRCIGRIHGIVEWECPNCQHWQKSVPRFYTGLVSCRKCNTVKYICLLLHRHTRQIHHTAPYDWLPPKKESDGYGAFDKLVKASEPAGAASPGPGTDSTDLGACYGDTAPGTPPSGGGDSTGVHE